MLKNLKLSVCLPITLVAVVFLTLAGCAGNTGGATPSPTPTPTPAAQDVVSRSVSSMTNLSSYQYAINMTLKLTGTLKGQPQNINLTASGDGTNDIADKKIQENLSAAIQTSGQGNMTVPVVFYLVDGWQYVQISVPLAGTQWYKSKISMTSLEGLDQAGQALQILKTAVKETVTGTEEVDNVPCYILQISPDLTVLSQWIKSFESTVGAAGKQLPSIDLSQLVKNLSITADITQDSYLLKKVNIAGTAAATAADLGNSAQAGDNLSLDFSQSVKMTQFNQPVVILLPPEAQNAKDITGQK
jgi:hypothetical protein